MTTIFELITAHNDDAKHVYPNAYNNGDQYTQNDGIGRILDGLNDDDIERTFKYELTPTGLDVRVRYHADTTSHNYIEGAKMWVQDSYLADSHVRPTRDEAQAVANDSNSWWHDEFAYSIESEFGLPDADKFVIVTKLHETVLHEKASREEVEAFLNFTHEVSRSEYFDASDFIEAWDMKHPEDDQSLPVLLNPHVTPLM